MESKIRDIARQKQQASRAQSLDLSIVLARIVEGTPETNRISGEGEEEGSDVENESPSSIIGGGSYANSQGGSGSAMVSPVAQSMGGPGSRMSAPAFPFGSTSRPHAMRMDSGLADDVIRGMRNK